MRQKAVSKNLTRSKQLELKHWNEMRVTTNLHGMKGDKRLNTRSNWQDETQVGMNDQERVCTRQSATRDKGK